MDYEQYLRQKYTDKEVRSLGLMAGRTIRQILNKRKTYTQNSYRANLPNTNIYTLRFYL